MKALSACLIFLMVLVPVGKAQYRGKPVLASDFVITNNEIWVLQPDSTLKVFNATDGRQIPEKLDPQFKICAITCDRNSAIIATDKFKKISRLNMSTLKWERIASYSGEKLYHVLFNSKNEPFLVTGEGIINPLTHEKWFPQLYDQYRRQYDYNNWHEVDEAPPAIMDRHDNIWVDIEHGEFGGDLHVFNTITHQFGRRDSTGTFIVKGYLILPVINFVQNQQNLYISAGFYGGGIVKCTQTEENKITTIKTEVIYDTKNNPLTRELFGGLGHISYNALNNCLYLSSTDGLYKGDLSTPLNGIRQWQKVPNFIIDPKDRRPNSYQVHYDEKTLAETDIPLDKGSAVIMGRIAFADNGNMVFLSNFNDVFLFNGKKLFRLK